MTDPDGIVCHILPDDGTGQPIRYQCGDEPLTPRGEAALRALVAAARHQFEADDVDGQISARQAAAIARIRERNARILNAQNGRTAMTNTATITYRVGDATFPPERPAIIAHVCNDVGGWGAGFTGALSRRWPQPEQAYRERHRDIGSNLGHAQVVRVDGDLWVMNMVAQHGIGPREGKPPIRYDALRECLRWTAGTATWLGASLHLPRIGCGLGGSRWQYIEPIVKECALAADVRVFVYDLPARSVTARHIVTK